MPDDAIGSLGEPGTALFLRCGFPATGPQQDDHPAVRRLESRPDYRLSRDQL